MTRALCSIALTLLMSGCAAEDPSTTATETTPAAPPAVETAPPAAAETIAPPPGNDAPVPTEHDVTGGYFPIDALPGDFAELEHLLLATIDENGAPAPLNGFLRPKARKAKDYDLVKPTLEGRQLTFETTSQGGVQYAFDGRFEVLGKFAENPPGYDTVVLAGTLRRIRDGQPAALTPVRFRYEAGG